MIKFFGAFIFVFAFSLVASNTAMARNYCIAGAGLTPICIYDDVESCAKAAEPPSTACIINPEARINMSGNGEYCVIHSGNIGECLYIDRGQCNDYAARAKGICVDRSTIGRESDPYLYDPRLQRF